MRWGALACVVASGMAWAADYHVAPGGDDGTGDGSVARPWASISHADSVVQPGDTVHVAPGTYDLGGNTLSTHASGTPSSRIVFVSDQHWGATVKSSATLWLVYGGYVDISGFDLDGAGASTAILDILAPSVRVIGNHVHNLSRGACTYEPAIVTNNNAGYWSDDEILGNVIHGVGSPAGCNNAEGIEVANLGGKVENNIVFDVTGFGIEVYGAPSQVTIANNLVIGSGWGGIELGYVSSEYVADAGNACSCDDYTVVFNNILVGNGTLSPHHGIGETSGDAGRHVLYQNNLLFMNQPDDTLSLLGGVASDNLLGVDPQFLNFLADGGGDYHLRASSPALNVGLAALPSGPNPGLGPSTDLDGNPRPGPSGGWDLGPYQSTAVDAGPAPVAVLTPADQSVRSGATVQLDGSASTAPVGTTLSSYAWLEEAGPTGAALSSGPQQSFTLAVPGTYSFRLVVTDSSGVSSSPARARVEVSASGCGCNGAGVPTPAWGWGVLAVRGRLTRRRRRLR